jgi:hypothetical protein
MTHPPEIRDLLWHVELLRALQGQREKVDMLEEEMEVLRQEAAQLGQQVEYLSKCQWPREMALWPPERVGLGRKLVEEVRLMNLGKPVPGSGPREEAEDGEGEYVDPNVKVENVNLFKDKWDFDRLVGKWRNHIKEDRQRRTPFVQSTGGSGSMGAMGVSGSGSGLHWLGERGRWETATPTEIKGMGNMNGVNGNPSPLTLQGEDAKRRAMAGEGAYGMSTASYPPMGPRKNISIISDFGGD